MSSTNTLSVCTSIADVLTVAGIPSVRVCPETDESGGVDTGAFTIQTEYGFVRLYLPSDLLEAFEFDRLARQKVRQTVSDLAVFFRKR